MRYALLIVLLMGCQDAVEPEGDCSGVWVDLVEPASGVGTWRTGHHVPVQVLLPDPLVRAWVEVDGEPVAELLLNSMGNVYPDDPNDGFRPVWSAEIPYPMMGGAGSTEAIVRAAEGLCEISEVLVFARGQ